MQDRSISGLDYVKEVGKRIVTDVLLPPLKRHFDYWWSCPDNIQSLKDEVRHLKRARLDMDQNIEEARYRAESATTGVRDWSDEGSQKLEEADRILQGCDELKPWNIIWRYQVGKSAKKTADGIVKLRNEVESIRISDPPLPQSMSAIPHEPTMEFESRRLLEEDIIESLKDDHVRMVAICGPGGVGKTTMVQRIEEKVRNVLFDEVVTVLVSQQIDKLKIQMEIAEMLGLHLTEASLLGREHKIRTRLLDSKKKLVIFDDVWKSFKLKDVGVPLGNGSEGCKIILTSRLKDVCEEMDADKVFQIKVLDDQESWRLFSEKSGVREDDSELRPIAEKVAAECKGLPIALVPIAKALKNKHIRYWEDSLLQLRRANPINFPKVLEDVYKPLKLSYDFLETESEKSIFLLCCLFPEGLDIPIELLTLYSIGLGILEGIRNIHEGRNRTHNLVERLKSSFLLIDGYWRDDVKMHDVVRDVAIFIGSREKHGFLKSLPVSSMDSLDSSCDCRWMSVDISNVNAELPVGSSFPNLRLLMIPEPYYQFGSPRFEKINEDDIDFKGMEELKVFSCSRRILGLFPPTLELLKNLKTLLLDNSDVRDISVVCKLTSLEILRIHYCRSVEELPADIGRLKRLRLLELRGCESLERVAEGVISSLVRLEELKIVGGFEKWGAKVNGSEERNASLLELESLPNLTWLEINISDCNLVAQEICLLQQLVRYKILFTQTGFEFGDMKYETSISLHLPGDIAVGNWIHQLVRNTQFLRLTGDGSNYLNLTENESLRNLMFTNSMVEFMVDGTILDGSNFFQNLEVLFISDLPKLAHLWRSPNQNVSLPNLKTITIYKCPNLRALFPPETARSLVQLQLLDIQNCGAIEQVFWNEMESNIEDEIIEFPRLTEIRISKCPKLSTKMGKCPNLQTISLHNFNGLHHLPSSRCTRLWITQLRWLSVTNCDTIEELLVDEIEDEGNHHMIFPKLELLALTNLPCLTTFYRGVESIKFPKLKNMEIVNLPKLNELAPMDSEPAHDDRCLHFFCNQKVEFSCLKNLTIGKLQGTTINKIWCCLVPNNFFCTLESLFMHDVNGIRNLMSSSIAENLVNLNDLHIARCQEMIEVVEDDIEISVTSFFPKLKSILIIDLHKLKCICQWKHALEFPSLCSVDIDGCPGMETFTSGPMSALHNFTLRIDGELVEEKDLNGGLRDHFKPETQKARREKRGEKRKHKG